MISFLSKLLQLIVATVNGAITVATKNLVVDGSLVQLLVGQRVLGAGISDGDVVVKVATVTDQQTVVLDKAITVANDIPLVFSDDTQVESKGAGIRSNCCFK